MRGEGETRVQESLVESEIDLVEGARDEPKSELLPMIGVALLQPSGFTRGSRSALHHSLRSLFAVFNEDVAAKGRNEACLSQTRESLDGSTEW